VAFTSTGPIAAVNVVIATGPYQRPVIPDLPLRDRSLFQVHASAYRHPDQLPSGAVLVVGSGASGAQIAEELARAGAGLLSIGRHKRVPRRYRGHDLIWWLETMRLDQMTIEQRGPDTTLALITGAYGGHMTISVSSLRRELRCSTIAGARDGVLHFADDLGRSLEYGDAAYGDFWKGLTDLSTGAA